MQLFSDILVVYCINMYKLYYIVLYHLVGHHACMFCVQLAQELRRQMIFVGKEEGSGCETEYFLQSSPCNAQGQRDGRSIMV